MKSFHIAHESFFRILWRDRVPDYIIAEYGPGEMWTLRAADIPSNRPEWVTITGDEWREAVRAVSNVRPPDAMGYLIYGWTQWRIAAGAKLE